LITNLSSISLNIFCFCRPLSEILGDFLLEHDLGLETGEPNDVEDKHSKNIVLSNIKYLIVHNYILHMK